MFKQLQQLSFKEKCQAALALFFSTVFVVFVACGGGSTQGGGGGGGNNPSAAAVVFTRNSNSGPRSHTLPTSGPHVLAASVFAYYFAATPSDIPESFESVCDFPSGFVASVPNGNLVPFLNTNGSSDPNNCSTFFSAAQPGGGSAQPLFHAGTIQTLVVTGVSTNGIQIRCSDLTTTSAASDKDFVVPYYRPSDNSVLLFNGTTQLSFSCPLSPTLTGGDTPQRLVARWQKL